MKTGTIIAQLGLGFIFIFGIGLFTGVCLEHTVMPASAVTAEVDVKGMDPRDVFASIHMLTNVGSGPTLTREDAVDAYLFANEVMKIRAK